MKKLILLSSALLGVIFLAGCGQQTARQTQSTTPAPIAEQPAVNQTADWKTYTSEKYGFSFQYPNDWKLSENSGSNSDRSVATIVSPETQKLAQDKQVIYSEDISVYYYPSVSDETENVLNKLKATTLEELIKKNTSITKIGSTEIGGAQATDVLWAGAGSYYTILATNNSHLYKIWFSNINNKDNLTSIEKTILSTFKFTSATPAGWETYTNADYGFSIQHPSNWRLTDSSMDRSCTREVYLWIDNPAHSTGKRAVNDFAGSLRISFAAGNFAAGNTKLPTIYKNFEASTEISVAEQITSSLLRVQAKPPVSTTQEKSYDNTGFDLPCGWDIGYLSAERKGLQSPYALCAPGTCVFPQDSTKPLISGTPKIIMYSEILSLATSTPPNSTVVAKEDGTTRVVIQLIDEQYRDAYNEVVSSYKQCLAGNCPKTSLIRYGN